jgi:hypothetical protein
MGAVSPHDGDLERRGAHDRGWDTARCKRPNEPERVYIASEHDDALTRHDGRAY